MENVYIVEMLGVPPSKYNITFHWRWKLSVDPCRSRGRKIKGHPKFIPYSVFIFYPAKYIQAPCWASLFFPCVLFSEKKTAYDSLRISPAWTQMVKITARWVLTFRSCLSSQGSSLLTIRLVFPQLISLPKLILPFIFPRWVLPKIVNKVQGCSKQLSGQTITNSYAPILWHAGIKSLKTMYTLFKCWLSFINRYIS